MLDVVHTSSPIYRSLAVGLTTLLSMPAVAAEPTECQQSLVPVDTPRPAYPSPEQARAYLPGTAYFHVFVEGKVSVEFMVTTLGTVSEPRITESTVDPIGTRRFARDAFDGFLETNVIPTLLRWKYEAIEAPCLARITFSYELEDDA